MATDFQKPTGLKADYGYTSLILKSDSSGYVETILTLEKKQYKH